MTFPAWLYDFNVVILYILLHTWALNNVVCFLNQYYIQYMDQCTFYFDIEEDFLCITVPNWTRESEDFTITVWRSAQFTVERNCSDVTAVSVDRGKWTGEEFALSDRLLSLQSKFDGGHGSIQPHRCSPAVNMWIFLFFLSSLCVNVVYGLSGGICPRKGKTWEQF